MRYTVEMFNRLKYPVQIRALCFALLAAFFISCAKEKPLRSDDKFPDNMILIQIAANNDLKPDALESFRKIKRGYRFDPNRRVLIYLKTESDRSHLMRKSDILFINIMYKFSVKNRAVLYTLFLGVLGPLTLFFSTHKSTRLILILLIIIVCVLIFLDQEYRNKYLPFLTDIFCIFLFLILFATLVYSILL